MDKINNFIVRLLSLENTNKHSQLFEYLASNINNIMLMTQGLIGK